MSLESVKRCIEEYDVLLSSYFDMFGEMEKDKKDKALLYTIRKIRKIVGLKESITLQSRISSLDFSVRTKNALNRGGIIYLYQLCMLEETTMLKIKIFGRKSLIEVNNFFSENGFSWNCEDSLRISKIKGETR